jgi:uncharacterized phiE125 gp8 family phage protein
MMLIEQTQVPDAALPVAQFRDHLRLGSGFADDGLQDAVLVPVLRAAIASVEAEIGKALYSRQFKYVVTAWRELERQKLPVAPVSGLLSLTITDLAGGEDVIDAGDYRLQPDAHRPVLRWLGFAFPTIPVGGTAEIEFTAGFAADWSQVPSDLAQAVLLLAAHYYDNRSAVGEKASVLPLGVAALLRPHREVRLFGGGR